VVAAAVGISCLDDTYPDEGRRALIRAWLRLQNVGESASDAMSAYLAARPDPFLRVVADPKCRAPAGDRSRVAHGAAASAPRPPGGSRGARAAVGRWLGRWSRRAQRFGDADTQARWQADRDAKIAGNLAQLTASEVALFQTLNEEVPVLPDLQLDRLAALLLAARPLECHAPGMLGWSFVQAVAADAQNAGEALAWVSRLNGVDPERTAEAARRLVEPVDAASSAPARAAAATLLRLLGPDDGAGRAEALRPRGVGQRWLRVERFSDTNPYDPDAPQPSNLDVARTVAERVTGDEIWTHISTTVQESDFRDVVPALARFDPTAVVEVLRRVIATAPERTGMRLRQLGWQLPELSPIFDAACVAAVRSAYDRLLADQSRVPTGDFAIVALQLFTALAPHLAAEEQLDLLLALPDSVPPFVAFRHALKPLPASVFERRLAAAVADTTARVRTLFFATAARTELTAGSRSVVAASLDSDDETEAACAAGVAYLADDAGLDDRVLEHAARAAPRAGDWGQHQERAIAAAIARRGRAALAALVLPQFAARTTGTLRDALAVALGIRVDRTLSRLLEPVAASPPPNMETTDRVSREGLRDRRSVEPAGEPTVNDGVLLNGETAEADARADERRRGMYDAVELYERALEAELGDDDVLATPPFDILHLVVDRDPARARGWLAAALAADDRAALGRVHNIALPLAGAYAAYDPDLAARVFRHLDDHDTHVNVVVGPEEVRLREHVLFRAPASEPIAALRRELFIDALDDETLARLTTAADTRGAGPWLDAFVDALVDSTNVGDQARGLAIAGFRDQNPASDRVLARAWSPGFLSDVSAHASTDYRRASWCDTWLTRAATAADGIEFWRYTALARVSQTRGACARSSAWPPVRCSTASAPNHSSACSGRARSVNGNAATPCLAARPRTASSQLCCGTACRNPPYTARHSSVPPRVLAQPLCRRRRGGRGRGRCEFASVSLRVRRADAVPKWLGQVNCPRTRPGTSALSRRACSTSLRLRLVGGVLGHGRRSTKAAYMAPPNADGRLPTNMGAPAPTGASAAASAASGRTAPAPAPTGSARGPRTRPRPADRRG
jgi:hypothetical protein